MNTESKFKSARSAKMAIKKAEEAYSAALFVRCLLNAELATGNDLRRAEADKLISEKGAAGRALLAAATAQGFAVRGSLFG